MSRPGSDQPRPRVVGGVTLREGPLTPAVTRHGTVRHEYRPPRTSPIPEGDEEDEQAVPGGWGRPTPSGSGAPSPAPHPSAYHTPARSEHGSAGESSQHDDSHSIKQEDESLYATSPRRAEGAFDAPKFIRPASAEGASRRASDSRAHSSEGSVPIHRRGSLTPRLATGEPAGFSPTYVPRDFSQTMGAPPSSSGQPSSSRHSSHRADDRSPRASPHRSRTESTRVGSGSARSAPSTQLSYASSHRSGRVPEAAASQGHMSEVGSQEDRPDHTPIRTEPYVYYRPGGYRDYEYDLPPLSPERSYDGKKQFFPPPDLSDPRYRARVETVTDSESQQRRGASHSDSTSHRTAQSPPHSAAPREAAPSLVESWQRGIRSQSSSSRDRVPVSSYIEPERRQGYVIYDPHRRRLYNGWGRPSTLR